ncbi:MAG: nicotinate-nucleotide adenylyltransferase [Candidatus Levyibacteriota bacterium]|jgi:nicotinate-nucleotide adenylyltransferase
MKIAILGGRFDPPHIGHFLVAKQVLDLRKDIDKVLFVPAFQHQWKLIIASPKDRIAMLQSFLESGMEISDIEIKRGGISYSIDTVREIKKQTGAEIFWIVGSDILSEFHRWKNVDDLLKLATFLVFPRDPPALPKIIPQGFEVVSSPKLLTTNFSSTAIREKIKNGEPIKYLVPEGVEEYIRKHNLYAK